MDFDKLNQRIAILEHRTVVDEIGNLQHRKVFVLFCLEVLPTTSNPCNVIIFTTATSPLYVK